MPSYGFSQINLPEALPWTVFMFCWIAVSVQPSSGQWYYSTYALAARPAARGGVSLSSAIHSTKTALGLDAKDPTIRLERLFNPILVVDHSW